MPLISLVPWGCGTGLEKRGTGVGQQYKQAGSRKKTAPDLSGGFIYGLAYLPGELEDGRQQQIVPHDLKQPQKTQALSSHLCLVLSPGGTLVAAHCSWGLLVFTPILIKNQ